MAKFKLILSPIIIAVGMLCPLAAMGQSVSVSGVVIDGQTRQPLPGAVAMLVREGESPKGSSTDGEGRFNVSVPSGDYVFQVSFLGYATVRRDVSLKADVNLGVIRMQTENKELDEVRAAGVMQRQEQRGDTTVYNAEAFKVNPDATTADLLKKIPGMQVTNGGVTSGGEQVKKVLVDGKEYFGDDPMTALTSLQADMVSKIEVYDRQSDQAQFTGFSDGNEERTINILTKANIVTGYFGNAYLGLGTLKRFEAGGNVNWFRGEHRVSVVLMHNNINQQNFSFDDGGGSVQNGRDGKLRTGSMGVNYVFERDKKLKIESSYFYSFNHRTGDTQSKQEYFLNSPDDSLRVYNSISSNENSGYGHRASMRMVWTIDPANSIIFTPRINWQDSKRVTGSTGDDSYGGMWYSHTVQNSRSVSDAFSADGSLMWRHKFELAKRTFSISISPRISNSSAETNSDNESRYRYDAARNRITSQEADNDSRSLRLGLSAVYTEPVNDYVALQFKYRPTVTMSRNNKIVEADTITAEGSEMSLHFSPSLSNKKSSDYWQHCGGVGISFSKPKVVDLTVGLDIQHSLLTGEQTYPYEFTTRKNFTSLLPSAMLRLRHEKSVSFRLMYNTQTNAPSITQLQKVVDVSSVRRYVGGNENLRQSYAHDFRFVATLNKAQTSRMIALVFGSSVVRDYIATSAVIAKSDTVIDYGVVLPRGTQYDKPVNVDGYWNARVNLTMSTPLRFMASNLNVRVGSNFSHTPGLYNNRKVESNSYSLTGGATIGSSFSETVDFTLSYDGAYNMLSSTTTAARNYNYYSHTVDCNVNCLFFTRMVFNNSLAHNMTSGMGSGFDKSYLRWNAAVGCKFFADRRAELRFKANDILNSTQSTTRSVQTACIQTTQSDVIRRFFLLTFTYKIKPEASNSGKQPKAGPDGFRNGPPPGVGMNYMHRMQ